MTDDTGHKALQLFLAGVTYAQIAETLNVPLAQVDELVAAEFAVTQQRRKALIEEASAVHQERTEALFRAHWGPALRGDHKSAEICRRILDRQGAQLFYGEAPTMEGDAVDEIATRRAARRAGRAG